MGGYCGQLTLREIYLPSEFSFQPIYVVKKFIYLLCYVSIAPLLVILDIVP